ncbi:MAG: MBL fold metallo-hydrolase, partial [Anaerolineae bacterium]
DPGGQASQILQIVEQERLTLRRIINTHAHFDHVSGVNDVKEVAGVPFYLHRADLPILDSYSRQLAYFGLTGGKQPTVDEYLEEGQGVEIGELVLRVLFTPGHSPGHVTFVYETPSTDLSTRSGQSSGPRVAFSGDVLFQGSIGRFDLPGGDYQQLMRSIREVLLPLGDDTVIYPGHGPATTIGQEKQWNPFL